MKKQKDFSTIVVRIYDTELSEKLNREYADSGGTYDSKNHLINELIEAGLERKIDDKILYDKLRQSDGKVIQTLNSLSERIAKLEKFTQFWMKYVSENVEANLRILSAVYALTEAANSREYIPAIDLESGLYDYPPDRFKRSTAEILEDNR